MTDSNGGRRAPWERRETETAKAYAGFRRYLELGPADRSLARAYSAYKGETVRKSAPAYFKRWSSEHEWVARAEEYDARVATSALEAREESRQRAYQTLADGAVGAARTLVDIMLGRVECPEAVVDDETGEISVPTSIADRRLSAASILDRAGVVTPRSLAGSLEEDDDLERLPYDTRQALLRAMSETFSENGKGSS